MRVVAVVFAGNRGCSFRARLQNSGQSCLADKGYFTDAQLFTMRNLRKDIAAEHARRRSVVENLFGEVQVWQVANNKFGGSVALQEEILMVVYELTQWKLLRGANRGTTDVMSTNVREELREFARRTPFGNWDEFIDHTVRQYGLQSP